MYMSVRPEYGYVPDEAKMNRREQLLSQLEQAEIEVQNISNAPELGQLASQIVEDIKAGRGVSNTFRDFKRVMRKYLGEDQATILSADQENSVYHFYNTVLQHNQYQENQTMAGRETAFRTLAYEVMMTVDEISDRLAKQNIMTAREVFDAGTVVLSLDKLELLSDEEQQKIRNLIEAMRKLGATLRHDEEGKTRLLKNIDTVVQSLEITLHEKTKKEK